MPTPSASRRGFVCWRRAPAPARPSPWPIWCCGSSARGHGPWRSRSCWWSPSRMPPPRNCGTASPAACRTPWSCSMRNTPRPMNRCSSGARPWNPSRCSARRGGYCWPSSGWIAPTSQPSMASAAEPCSAMPSKPASAQTWPWRARDVSEDNSLSTTTGSSRSSPYRPIWWRDFRACRSTRSSW